MKTLKKCTILLFSIFIVFTLVCCGKPTAKSIAENLNKENSSKTINQIKELSSEEQEKLLNELENKVNSTTDDFINNKIDKTKALKVLTTIKSVPNMNELATKSMSNINNIHNSRTAFESAKKFEESNDNFKALENYSKVIPEDKSNYEFSQSKITELNKKIEDSIPIKVVNKTLSRDSIDNQIANIQFINKSDKPIKEIMFSIFGYDSNKYPVKVNFNYDDYYKAKLDSVLQPGETSKADWGWTLYNNAKEITELVVSVSEVHFFAGEPWKNPSYNSDLTKYSGKPLK